jgi:membrane protein DedA with SNARE-associated domain
MLESLTDLISASPWTYAAIFAIAALDAVFPVLPSETAVITAGVVAGSGDLSLPLLIALAAIGAFAGDSAAYGIGRLVDGRVHRLLVAGRRGKRRFELVERAFATRGTFLVLAGRFVPGGRTAVTVTAGATAFPYRRFAGLALAAGVLWATYAALLGYLGGRVFEDEPLKAMLFGLGLAGGAALMIEAVRRVRGRRSVRPAFATRS